MARKKNLLTGNSRQEERRIQAMLQSRIANQMSNEYRKEIKSSMTKMASLYEKEGTDLAIASAVPAHEMALTELTTGEWRRAARMAGDRISGAVKSMHGKFAVVTKEIDEELESEIEQFIQSTAIARIAGIASTTVEDVRRRIRRGEAEGFTVDEIAKNIREAAATLSVSRSMMIARTESHGAYNMGSHFASLSSNLDLNKEWISSLDERTRDDRFDHVHADGETVPVRDVFVQTGEDLRFPGDPRGSSGNVIYCRCAKGDVVA